MCRRFASTFSAPRVSSTCTTFTSGRSPRANRSSQLTWSSTARSSLTELREFFSINCRSVWLSTSMWNTRLFSSNRQSMQVTNTNSIVDVRGRDHAIAFGEQHGGHGEDEHGECAGPDDARFGGFVHRAVLHADLGEGDQQREG